MSNRDHLNDYLRAVESRLRSSAWARGVAALILCALVATLLLVLFANGLAFSAGSILTARFALFVVIALALVFGILMPLLRVNRRNAARRVEQQFPDFQERLLTFAENGTHRSDDPFLELLAADTVQVAQQAEPKRVASSAWLFGSISAAVGGLLTLLWLITAGPGYLGHGAALLWGATPKIGAQPFYEIKVTPGDSTVRKGANQEIAASLVGFQTARVRLFARYQSASKWEETPMLPQESGPGFQFLFAGVAEPLEYYVEAGGLRSNHYKLSVVDLPGIKRMRITYKYPGWVGMQDVVQTKGGDLRAITGTEAEVAIEMDRPMPSGVLVLDGEKQIPLQHGEGNWLSARVPIQKDGLYHIGAIDNGKEVRLSEDFFIEAQKETPPVVKLKRPGRDAKVSPIEEVGIEVQAEDDFALASLEFHYSVNGGPEKTVPMLSKKGVKQATGNTMISLEDFKLAPGDIVSLYATARDARSASRTDMFFLEAQPFEREYTQSQEAGGGEGGGGEGQQQNQISQRQKELIAATWNQMRDGAKERAAAAENAKFLSSVQSKLRDQSRSLAQRMKSRQLSGENQQFNSFSKDMETAAEAMGAAVEQAEVSEVERGSSVRAARVAVFVACRSNFP